MSFHDTLTSPQHAVEPGLALSQIAEYRGDLLRYARWTVDAPTAEDLVQDTLLAAFKGHVAFAGRSSPRTWLVGILKHKIADQLRRRAREVPFSDVPTDGADPLDPLYDATGRLKQPPRDWDDPEAVLLRKQFADLLHACIDRLPPAQARAFVMREMLELDTGEICRELGVTPNHCFVLLHRARMNLRSQLESTGFRTARLGDA